MSNDVDREADIVMASNYRSNVLKKPMVTFAKENTVYPPAGIFNTFRSNEDRKTEEDKVFWNNVLEMPDSPVLQSQAVSNKSLTSQVGTKRIKQSPSIEYIGTFNGPPVRKIQSTQQVFSQAATLKTETIDEAMRSVQQAFFYHETCIKGKVSQIVTNISIIEKKWVMKVELSDFIGKTLVCEIDPNLLVKYIGMTTEEAKKLKKEGNQKAKEDANQRMNKLKKDLVNKQLLFTLEIYADSGQCPMIKNIKKISEPDFYI
uniref:RMI1_C domain-containing protein n=1 Tax=Rhabditophanes sp. KR3021 TaxID=114890 RepID=A0AC35TTD2_9BILA